jgi:hypothetical protein
MKRFENILLASIPLDVALIVGFFVIFSLINYDSRVYNGSKQFNSFEEATVYQLSVLQTAKEYKVAHAEVTISVSSPPIVSYRIIMPSKYGYWALLPEDSYFPLGQQEAPPYAVWWMYGFVCLPFFIMSCLFYKDLKKDEQTVANKIILKQ